MKRNAIWTITDYRNEPHTKQAIKDGEEYIPVAEYECGNRTIVIHANNDGEKGTFGFTWGEDVQTGGDMAGDGKTYYRLGDAKRAAITFDGKVLKSTN